MSEQAAPSAALRAIGARPRLIQRRPTRQATYELKNHAKAYLEAGQIHNGFDFLCSLLATGTSISTPAQPHTGYLAPPAYISFASSIIVDPKFTTQVVSSHKARGTQSAFHYLQCIQTIIDGLDYRVIRSAFSFPVDRTRRRAPGYRGAAGSPSPDLDGDVEKITGEDANQRSLWYRAEDFWHIIGWAFNCSVAHKPRWSCWKLWLSNMLDFLETDWDFCVKLSKRRPEEGSPILRQGLIWYYIVGDASSVNRGARRRIVKAILAVASAESLKEYPEIWARETAEVKKKPKPDHPVTNVNFENGEIGDYQSEEEMPDVIESDQILNVSTVIETPHDAAQSLGGQDAIILRQRILSLIANVAFALPAQFTTLSDFFDNVLEDFNQLPTLQFQLLISTLAMPTTFRVAFCGNLLLPLVTGKIPNYFRDRLVQDHLESRLLALKATTQSYATNAKVSLILEQMMLTLMGEDGSISPTTDLTRAMEHGIAARCGVHGIAKGKKGNAQEEQIAQEVLQASSERLLGLLETLEIGAGIKPQAQILNTTRSQRLMNRSFTSGSSLSPAPDSDTEPDD